MLAFSAWALVLPKDLLNDMLLLLQKRCIWFYSLLYETYASFSAQLAYNDWFLSLYNVFFTSLPVIALGVFDQDVSARYCLKFPILYQEGIQNVLFSWQSYNSLDVERRLQCSYYLLHLHNSTRSSILQ